MGRFFFIHQKPSLLKKFRMLVDEHYLQASYERISGSILPPVSPRETEMPVINKKKLGSPGILKFPSASPSTLRPSKRSLSLTSPRGNLKDASLYPIPPSPSADSRHQRMQSKMRRTHSPDKKEMRSKHKLTAKKQLEYAAKGKMSDTDLLDFVTHTHFDSEERTYLRNQNNLGYGDLDRYGWRYAEKDSFDRAYNTKLRNYLAGVLGQQNKLGETYTAVFDHKIVGADFYDDVYELVEQTGVRLGIQNVEIFSQQDNRYFRVNSGGRKKLGTSIKAFNDNGVEVYTLIITFTELEVVLDSSKSGNYQFTTPVYLKMAPKRMLIIRQDIFFWYPKNNTDLSKRWVEFKVVGTRMNEAHVERESEM